MTQELTLDIYRKALKVIAGLSDEGMFIFAYRDAGGGYNGLQAIAKEALAVGKGVDPDSPTGGRSRDLGPDEPATGSSTKRAVIFLYPQRKEK